MTALQLMTDAYITAMHWASTDENGDPLDNYPTAAEAKDIAATTCNNFLKVHGDDLAIVMGLHPHYGYEQAGHDLFLTREGHGAGFWDRDLGHYGDVFTKYCQSIGAADPYVGDDGYVYVNV